MATSVNGKQRVTIWIEDDLLNCIEILAASFGSDKSEVIRRCIDAGKDLLRSDLDPDKLQGDAVERDAKLAVLALIGDGAGNTLAAAEAGVTRSLVERWEQTDPCFRQLAKDRRDLVVERVEKRLLELAFGDNPKNNVTSCFGYLNARSEHYGPQSLEKLREPFNNVLACSVEAARATWGDSGQLLAFSERLSRGIDEIFAAGVSKAKGRR